ncbi:MAG: hypothetical protein AAB466_14815 [Verrucomicrobiota bacterium]
MNSKATPGFWQRYNALPREVQELARKSFRLWLANPFHPSLQFKPLKGDLWSARVGLRYRAAGVFLDGDTFRWTWIGSHENYNKL